jgi:hypothetical protein
VGAHWLLYVGPGGEQAVVATRAGYGFEEPDAGPFVADGVVCAETFVEFLYRYWIENEIFFALREGGLTAEQLRYVEHYASWTARGAPH